jgi:hypothetical protein
MYVMGEDLMAMSLLYALLGVDDMEELEDLGKQYGGLAAAAPLPKNASDAEKRAWQEHEDKRLAVKYHKAPLKQKKEVRKALYDALYHILEYSNVNRSLSMAIGKALCNARKEAPEVLRNDIHITRLYEDLKPVVTEAIDELENPSPEQQTS